MAQIYYGRYDVLIDSKTGKFLESICSCTSEDNCLFKNAWIEDGSPERLSEDVLEDLRK